MSYDVTQKTVLALLSSALFQKPYSVDESVDWKAVFEECRAQSVLSLAFSALPKDNVSDSVYAEWKEQVNAGLLVNSGICYAHTMLHELLTNAGITYVILKGCASAEYYNDPLLRTMGDVDFFVPLADFDRTDKLLKNHGFEPHNIDHEYEKAYSKNDVVFELHNTINGIPGGKTGAVLQQYFEDIFEKAMLKQLDLAQYNSPSPFHHGLIMLLHVARHMITGGIGLRHFCDWAVFVERICDDFPMLFEDKLKAVGLWHFAQIMTQFSVAYLGCNAKPWTGKIEYDLLRDLKNDVFAGGNFGHKDLKRADEAKFITSRKQGGVNRDSNAKQAVLSANEIVRKHWKVAGKVPVLYPAGWAFFGGRYLIRAIRGKREKVNVSELVKGAGKRKDIYLQMDLFSVDK